MAKVVTNVKMLMSLVRPNISFNKTNFVYTRFFSETISENNKRKLTNGVPYQKYLKLYKISREGTLTTLQKILQINKTLATKIVTNNKELCQISSQFILDNYEICKIYGVTNETIINCSYLLSLRDLSEKIHILNRVPDDKNKMVGLLTLDINELSKIVTQYQSEVYRIIYFSELLHITPMEMYEHIKKKPFLMKVSLEKVLEIIDLLKEHGITNQEILKDLWALNYKKNTMEKRIQFAKENNLEKVKTWMIRAPPEILLNYIKIRSENKLILGNNSLAEYLSNRLECQIEQANYLITKLPALKTKSVKKMDEIIDYLYEQRFKPNQICITPKILLHSVETMKKRIQELQHQGVYVDNLSVLTKTQKQYQIYLNKLISENSKKLKAIMKKL